MSEKNEKIAKRFRALARAIRAHVNVRNVAFENAPPTRSIGELRFCVQAANESWTAVLDELESVHSELMDELVPPSIREVLVNLACTSYWTRLSTLDWLINHFRNIADAYETDDPGIAKGAVR